jgi:hypothetical protein
MIAASGFKYFFSNVRPVPYCRYMQLQRSGGLTGVCVALVLQPGAHWMKRPSFDSIRIQSHRAEVIVVS